MYLQLKHALLCVTALHHPQECTETECTRPISESPPLCSALCASMTVRALMNDAEEAYEASWKVLSGRGKLLGCAQPQYSQYFSVCRPRRGSILYYSSDSADPKTAGYHGEPSSAQLVLRQSMLSCLEEKGVAITDLKSGTCLSGSPQMNENVPAITPYCRIDLCVCFDTHFQQEGFHRWAL